MVTFHNVVNDTGFQASWKGFVTKGSPSSSSASASWMEA